MRVLVCGGRHYDNAEHVFKVLDALNPKPFVIIHGAARGADSIAGAWAMKRDVHSIEFAADWDNTTILGAVIRCHPGGRPYNVAAGRQRNQRMIDEGKPDLVIAFPGKLGTEDMKRRATRAGIEVREV